MFQMNDGYLKNLYYNCISCIKKWILNANFFTMFLNLFTLWIEPTLQYTTIAILFALCFDERHYIKDIDYVTQVTHLLVFDCKIGDFKIAGCVCLQKKFVYFLSCIKCFSLFDRDLKAKNIRYWILYLILK